MREEVRIHATVSKHRHIVGLHEAVMTTDTHQCYMIMELAVGGELFDAIVKNGPYSELEAQAGIVRIVDALVHVHSMGVIHRDIKPENIVRPHDSIVSLVSSSLRGVDCS